MKNNYKNHWNHKVIWKSFKVIESSCQWQPSSQVLVKFLLSCNIIFIILGLFFLEIIIEIYTSINCIMYHNLELFLQFQYISLLISLVTNGIAYDPNDKSLKDILLPEGQFEAFYLKGSQDQEQNAVRPPHLHGSFHQYKNPALVGAPNSAAYGFRFDGKRRFNYN